MSKETVLLRAAEAALDGNTHMTLIRAGYLSISRELLDLVSHDKDSSATKDRNNRSLYLCFLAAEAASMRKSKSRRKAK